MAQQPAGNALPRPPRTVDGDWRHHFEKRALWPTDEAGVSAWSSQGLAARLATFEHMLPVLAPRPGTTVLDLGCGAGTYTGLLASRGHRVIAADYAFPMVWRARAAHDRAHFLAADGFQLPFRPASFDLVLCIGVLSCCRDARALVGEAARLLRPGGGLLVENLNPLHLGGLGLQLLQIFRRPAARVVRHPARVVEGWLDAAGIEIRQRLPIYVEPPPATWPAGPVLRACFGLPVLWRLGTAAIWWHGHKPAER